MLNKRERAEILKVYQEYWDKDQAEQAKAVSWGNTAHDAWAGGFLRGLEHAYEVAMNPAPPNPFDLPWHSIDIIDGKATETFETDEERRARLYPYLTRTATAGPLGDTP